jgi:hypothetical protein
MTKISTKQSSTIGYIYLVDNNDFSFTRTIECAKRRQAATVPTTFSISANNNNQMKYIRPVDGYISIKELSWNLL